MDYDRCFALSTLSRHCQSTPKCQFDICIDFEDIEEDDEEVKVEYACPFCSEDFDFVGLCCHIDEEHHIEAKSGVCPICLTRAGMDMVGHITTVHGNISNISFYHLIVVNYKFILSYNINAAMIISRSYPLNSLTRDYSWHRLKLHKGYSHSTLLSSRKELENGHFQSLLARSSSSVSSSKMASDPWLSFIYNVPTADVSDSVESNIGERAKDKSSCEKIFEPNVQPPSLSDKDHLEKMKKREFVQGLLWSTIMYDGV